MLLPNKIVAGALTKKANASYRGTSMKKVLVHYRYTKETFAKEIQDVTNNPIFWQG